METTHATYIFHADGFIRGGYSGDELESFLDAHDRLGYAFVVTAVDVSAEIDDDDYDGSAFAELDITVEQVGIAPFYYPLSLHVRCDGQEYVTTGVESLIDRGEKRTFNFDTIPATEACLDRIEIFLDSPMSLPGRPIKFAQGDGTVEVSVPFEGGSSSLESDEQLVRLTLVQESGVDAGSLHNGAVLSSSSSMSIRADASANVRGVAFRLGEFSVTDFHRPFLLTDEDLIAALFRDVGEKDLTVRAYDNTGNQMGDRTVSFEVVPDPTQKRLLEVRRDVPADPVIESEPRTIEEQQDIVQRSPRDLMHGFNTPATPTLLQVISFEKEQATRTAVFAFMDRLVGLLMLFIHGA